MSLPVNLVFFIDVAAKPNYRATIESYRTALSGFSQLQGVYAHVKISEATKYQLPDVIDFLYDNDIHPLVSKSESLLLTLTQYKDVYDTFNFDQVHSAPFILFVNGDAGVSSKDGLFLNYVANGMDVLGKHKDALTIDVLTLGLRTETIFSQIPQSPFRLTLMRTRDLYLSVKLALNNQNQFGGLSYERALNNIFQTLSQHPLRHLAFNPALATLS